jgi:PTH1 family peptidyl-tRNA hydrolase
MAVERIAKEEGFPDFTLRKSASAQVSEDAIAGEKVILVLPEVSMNVSGKVIPSFVKSKPAAKKLIIIRDELDMPLGTMKMTFGRGSGGHKGAESIMRAIKTKDFAQIKIGISGQTAKGKLKKPGDEDKVAKHVLGKWKPEEEKILKKMLERTVQAVHAFVEDDIERAMLIANTK